MTRPIILDCDPGLDDAVALLLAQGSPEIELLAVTTVSGNQTIGKVTRNALAIARVAGITAPIAEGAGRPLVGDVITAGDVHGESGLEGVTAPEPDRALDPRHAVRLIIDTVMASEPGTVTLVPTGPLTNIALAARLEPRIVERVREVVLMGGGAHTGNWSATAEFNIAADPEAAAVVFGERWPLTMVGLDLTHQARAIPSVQDRVAAIGTGPARFLGEVFASYGASYRRRNGDDAPPVHDPCAVAYVIDPTLIRAVRAPITVELRGERTRGTTVVDLRHPAEDDVTTRVALDLDAPRFWDLVVDAVSRLP